MGLLVNTVPTGYTAYVGTTHSLQRNMLGIKRLNVLKSARGPGLVLCDVLLQAPKRGAEDKIRRTCGFQEVAATVEMLTSSWRRVL